MKVLSVKNPWAYMIMFHGKDVENRSRPTKYRGRILIHASKTKVGMGDFCLGMPVEFGYIPCVNLSLESDVYNGKIIGSIELVDCVQNSTSRWAESGFWHWIVQNPVPLVQPIPAKGKLGLWEYTPSCNECKRICTDSEIDFLPICESDFSGRPCKDFTF